MPNADVFISYRRDQRDQVLVIAEKLQELGLSVWFDARLEAGSSFDEEINREVRSAKCVFVCWSPEAMQSRWVRAEASIGLERDVLVAAFLHPAELMPPYNLVHAANLEGWNGTHDDPAWGQVLARVGRLVEKPDLADIARAKLLESRWIDADRQARQKFREGLAEARRLFNQRYQSLPAQFEQKLAGLGDVFEGWIAKRRLGATTPPPSPLTLTEDETETLQAELRAVRAEHSAAVAQLTRVMKQREVTPAHTSASGANGPLIRWMPIGLAFAGGAAIVLLFVAMNSPRATEEWATEEPAAAATESMAADPAAAATDSYDYSVTATEGAATTEAAAPTYTTP